MELAYELPSGAHILKITQIASRAGGGDFQHDSLAATRLCLRQAGGNVLLLRRRRRARGLRKLRYDPADRTGNGPDRIALGVRPLLEKTPVALGYNPVTPLGVPSPVRKS